MPMSNKASPKGTLALPKLDKKRIKLFLEANPTINIQTFNFFDQQSIQKLEWDHQDAAKLLPQLKALQRLVRLTNNLETAEALYENGLHAAVQIAAIPQHKFVQQYASLFTPNGLSTKEQAKQVHQRALARKSQALLTYTAIAQHRAPHYRATRFDNLSAATENNYNNLPSYQDLFGELDFCSCDDCRSIFSPAAYFVDLMRLQDNYIDTTATPPNQLLQARRPDLWELVLSCENTNTLVPKLQIVNQVLLQTLGQDATYQQLATTNYPFNLPFHLPLTQIQLYLAKNNQSLPSIWQTLIPSSATSVTWARQSLCLSPEQWELYSTPPADQKELALLYGIPKDKDILVFLLFDIELFELQTGLNYVQLRELIYEDLSDQEVNNGLNAAFFINSNVTDPTLGPIAIGMDPSYPQLGVHLVNLIVNNESLSFQRLDHVNRFIRLAQALSWSFTDLDWALRTIGGIVNTTNNSVPVIRDDVLPYLAWLQTLQQQYKLSMNQSCALIGTIKDMGQKNGPTFFDQIFNNAYVPNPPSWKDNQGTYSLIWNVPQPGSQDQPSKEDLQIQNALAAALQVSQDDLLRIAYLVLQALEFTDNKLPLTLPNLSILYRLSQLPALTGLSIQACFTALSLPGQPTRALGQLASAAGTDAKDSLVLLTQFAQWLRTTHFSVYQLQFILTGSSQDATIQNQMLGLDKITNFRHELCTAIHPTLLTEEQFTTALSTLMQRSGSSPEAIQAVYNSLIQGNYIDATSKVIKVPTATEMQPIVAQVFPTFLPIQKPQDNSGLEFYMSQLGSDLIQLLTSYLGETLSEDTFTSKAAPAFQNDMPLSCLLSSIWDTLKSNNQYVDQLGIITSFVEAGSQTESLNSLIQSLLFPHIPQELLENIQTTITKILQSSYQLQQKILTQKLAALYDISPNLVHALEVWGGLTLEDLEASQIMSCINPNPYAAVPLLQRLLAKPAKRWSKDQLLQAKNQDVAKRLQLLQQYATLIKSLALSPAEAQSIVEHPECFGIKYNQGNEKLPLPQFTLANIQTLYQFKQLVQGFQDTQNNLLNYLALASTSKDFQTIAKELAQVTQWDADQIQFLLQKLWPSNSTDFSTYATVGGVGQLQSYFSLTQQLNLDIASLWQLANTVTFTTVTSTTDYPTYQSLADALWAGLQKQYQNQPNQLSVVQGKIDEAKRNVLLSLVINQLRIQNKLIISTTARDVYEYLLIDVEVSGIVQTSYIKEAISAVQLYIYRCYNSLEADITVEEELNTWWPWLEHYRVWQANREVFLYPENYIQPELRTNKSPQFIQLENDLQQSNLTASVVDTAVKAYLNGFAEVATLQIVGSYLYAQDASIPPNQQILYLVGRTNTKAYAYYYRTAIFNFDQGSKTYIATQWNPWITIDLQIKSTLVSPVYAFNKLFLFWTEAKPGPSDKDATGQPTQKRFEATLYYSFYDFNQRWSAPQQLIDPIMLPADSVSTQAAAEASVWQQIKVIFDPTMQLIYWEWGEKDTFYTGTLSKQLDVQIEHLQAQAELKVSGITYAPSAVVYQDRLYCFHQGSTTSSTTLWYSVLENGTWQLDNPVNINKSGMSEGPSAVEFQGKLYCFYYGGDNKSLWYSVLENGTWQPSLKIKEVSLFPPSLTAPTSPCAVVYQKALYCFYIDYIDEKFKAFYCVLQKDGTTWITNLIRNDIEVVMSSTVVEIQRKLYYFYGSVSGDKIKWWYTVFEDDTWQVPQQGLEPSNDTDSFGFVECQGKLCCFVGRNFFNFVPQELQYMFLEEDGTWSPWSQVIGTNIGDGFSMYMFYNPSAVVYQNKLYIFYASINDDPSVSDGKLWYSMLWPLSNRALDYLGFITEQENLPPRVVAGTDLTWTTDFTWAIDTGPDGTQFLTIPIQDSTNKQYIRLNSMVVPELSSILFSQGIDGFLALDIQKTPEINIDGSKTPTLDFAGANGLYYWEIFFHLPFLVGHILNTQQQFELAKQWYAYIFNPTMNQKSLNLSDKDDPNDKYWQFLGLQAQYNPTLKTELQDTWALETLVDVQNIAQLAAYHNDPFDPHAIAQLRPIAYQKSVVMHYIDNLLDWADNLFRQYTIETIVEATMLYIMAYDLLGKQPVNLGPCPLPNPETLTEIAKHYGDSLGKIPEFLIQVEQSQARVLAANAMDTPNNYIPGDYFGLPENDQFTAYWDKVQQRLYNIRHNLNIEGVYEQLALFQPPINPMQLVAAIAAGEGVEQALAGNQVDVPYYRFSVMVAKAQAITQTVIQLGQNLLSVLEKQDAEQLSLLYNSNQQNLLALTRTSKQDQLEAATQSVQTLQASLKNAQDRLGHYTQLLNSGLSAGEKAQIALEAYAIVLQTVAQPIKGIAIAGYLTPTIYGLADGGMKIGDAILQGATTLEGASNAVSMSAGLASTIAGYQRRTEDWELQQTLAQDDLNQINCQILAAQYQERIAEQEITLLENQIAQEQAIEAFLKNKFTRTQMYQWMVGKLSALYFQAYQLAYNLAIQAEKAWQFERCKQQSFINPIYWQDLYQGLVAGEALQLDLQRMEKAYMDQDERKLEIEKVISLAQLDPQALQDLKNNGSCSFDLTEQDFDYDYPGHYCRQIKSISLSFPALLGPYQNIHATLTQTGSKVLLQADVNGIKYLLGKSNEQPEASILRVDMRASQQIALSQGLNDNGLFVLNFDDTRYLPFEGTGVVSSWRLDMPKPYNAINFDSITDVIIRLQYTALSGGSVFQATVEQNLGDFKGNQLLMMAQEYASAWYGFIQQEHPLQFSVGPNLFRPNLSGYKVTSMKFILMLTEAGEKITTMPQLELNTGASSSIDFTLTKNNAKGTLSASVDNQSLDVLTAVQWQLTVKEDEDDDKLMTAANVSNMVIILNYTASLK
ncbi:MAG: Tc toxin subunit A-related protein [Candidatus Amoebophilus sp.]